MLLKCPKCSAQVEYILNQSEFCSECGSELITAEKNNTADKQDVFSSVDFKAIFSQISTSAKPAQENWDLSNISRETAENIDSKFVRSGSECSYLKVEYNHNLFFLNGSQSIIKLRITPLRKELQNVIVFMEVQSAGIISRRQIPVQTVIQMNRSFSVDVPFTPEKFSGKLSLKFYLGCVISGGINYYEFSIEHKVYDSNLSGAALFNQITINQDFTASDAADITYRDSIGDALKKMSEKAMTVNELIDRLNDLPTDFRTEILTATSWRPENVLVKGMLYPTDKLLLEWNGKSVYLFNKTSIKFGRDKENVDIIVHSPDYPDKQWPNSTVSRKHAEVIYCEDTVKLFDYSSYGTYIDGRKPDSAGIPLKNKAVLEFGDIHWNMEMQNCYGRQQHNICQTCGCKRIKSMTFKRADKLPEYYLLIWQCCELGRVIEELSDWTVFSRNGSFFIRTPDMNFYYLRPGMSIKSNAQEIKVKYFQQY